MQNMLVVNAEGPETRVAVVEEGALAEFFVERKRDRGMVGNIYRGKVTRVLPGMQAAFVDLGPKVERAAFLYVADVLGAGDERKLFDDTDTDDGDESPEGAASRIARSRKQLASRKIEDLLKPGQNVLVQVVKDPIGLKGARVTGYISLPGRYSVFMPHVAQVGVSQAHRLRQGAQAACATSSTRRGRRARASSCAPPPRTPAIRSCATTSTSSRACGARSSAREDRMAAPASSTPISISRCACIRDLMREDTSEVIDRRRRAVRARARSSRTAFLPRFAERIKKYEGRRPIFDHHHIEPALRLAVVARACRCAAAARS